MSYMKSLARSGADGNTRLLKEYGGKETKAKAYANGGSVFDDEEDDDDDMEGGDSSSMDAEVDGMSAKPRMDRPGRKMKGKDKDKKGGTNVNVIIMPKSDGPADAPVGPAPAAANPMPPPPPPMAPPMAGGPPMPPMRKHGGGVGAYANGGKVARECKAEGGPAYGKMKDGAGGAAGRLQKIKAYGK